MKLDASADTHCMTTIARGSRADSPTDCIMVETKYVISSIKPSFASACNERKLFQTANIFQVNDCRLCNVLSQASILGASIINSST